MIKVPPILSATGLSIQSLGAGRQTGHVVRSVDLAISPGESIGIAGESGSGKSTLLLALMGMLRPGLALASGQVHFGDRPLLGMTDRDLQDLRGGRIALIPQNAATAMTPTIRIGDQIDEALRLHTSLSSTDRTARTLDLLDRTRLPDPERLSRRFPHELSGGQMQRAAIAMALAGDPEVLLLDEPTTGLDVTTQLAILDLLVALRRSSGVAMICVSHDLGVLSMLCDRIAVMYSGGIVEDGPSDQVLTRPAHPYTHALLGSLPRISETGVPNSIPGAPPQPHDRLPGCRYAPRCPQAGSDCLAAAPALEETTVGRRVACYHRLTDAARHSTQNGTTVPTARPEVGTVALSVEDLVVSYARPGLIRRLTGRHAGKPAVDEVSFSLRRGEVLGFVGESGSGKSTVLRAISGIWPASAGQVLLAQSGAAPTRIQPRLTDRPLSQLRIVQLVFQNPDASLNPRQRVSEILAQPLLLYRSLGPAEIRTESLRLLSEVRLGPAYLDRFPSQMSGGERQRVAIARAFAAQPDVLLCDEITTALDVSVQAAVLGLVRDLATTRNVATIFVSHDLGVVRAISDRIAVLFAGQLVEMGSADDVCLRPDHPCTRALLDAVLEPGESTRTAPRILTDRKTTGTSGCAFAPRCPDCIALCTTEAPDLYGDAHQSRCFLSQMAPKAVRQA